MEWAGLPVDILVMRAGSADLTTANFHSFQDGHSRTAYLPEPPIQRRVWIVSAYGWLVTADEECALHLLNPVTGAQAPLPPIGTMGYFELLPKSGTNGNKTRFLFRHRSFLTLHWPDRTVPNVPRSVEMPLDRMTSCFLRKAVPLRDPTSSGEYFVMMIHGPLSKLVFARQRDAKWVALPSSYSFDDVISCKGQVYTITSCGTVLIWEPDGETFKPRVAVPEHSEEDEFVYFRKYLAESLDGDLVLVWREYRSCYGEESDSSSSDDDNGDDNGDLERLAVYKPDPTVRFHVFVLHDDDGQGSKWRELHDLNGAALFIGYNSAVFFSADDIPGLLPDCIYFTDDKLAESWHLKEDPRDMGVFDMKSKLLKPMLSLIYIYLSQEVGLHPFGSHLLYIPNLK